MLLAAHTYGLNFGSNGAGLAQRAPDAAGRSFAPGMRVLLLRAGRKVRDQVIFLRRRGEHLSIAGVNNENFSGLSAAIDSEDQCSHICSLRYSVAAAIADARTAGKT